MAKIKKLFGEFDFTWPRVILFAVMTAVITAGLNEIRFLNDTSFQDIAIAFECWFLFAIFIIVNCKTWWEAALKTFVFFLISQPLIYLLEVPFEPLGWGVFMYYPRWFKLTVLTLPGGAIAHLITKEKWYSVPVLSVATGYLSFMTVWYLNAVIESFPHHLLSSVFCLFLAVFLPFVIFDGKKLRISSLGISMLVLIAAIIYCFIL